MSAEIGPGASVAQLARSIQGLADILKNANEQSMGISEKLLRMKVQENIEDASLGNKIDTEA
ncbi:MAG TPA: hypothetical protein VL354_02990 [Spirochaetia bacterium]|nr:hypothetical protein [Spirochaetia bacterium]